MKKYILSIIVLLFVGCATLQDAVPQIPSIVSFVNEAVLDYAVKNPQHRQQLANDEYAFATGFRSLMTGTTPTPAQVKDVFNVFSVNAGAWSNFSPIIGDFYSRIYPKIQGDPKLAMDVLEGIAEGMEQSAKNILETENN